jgi:hypothetical protein
VTIEKISSSLETLNEQKKSDYYSTGKPKGMDMDPGIRRPRHPLTDVAGQVIDQ